MNKSADDIGLSKKLLNLRSDESYKEISLTWWRNKHIFLIAFMLIWDVFLVIYYLSINENDDINKLLSPILHVIFGVWLTYYVLMTWINKTYVRISKDVISVKQKPIPWFGNCILSMSELKEVYSKEVVTDNVEFGKLYSYEVHVITHSGQRTVLLKKLFSMNQADFIVREISDYLK